MPKYVSGEAYKAEEERLNEPVTETPSVLPPRTPNLGRLSHGVAEAGVQTSMDVTAAKAMAIIKAHVEYRRKSYRHISTDLQRACEYVIDHAIGKARQKIEHSGGILTYGSLAKEAEKIASKPRDILADAEEIASKRHLVADLADLETAQRQAGLERMLAKVDALPEDKPEPLPDALKSKTEGETAEPVENLALAEELTPRLAPDEPEHPEPQSDAPQAIPSLAPEESESNPFVETIQRLKHIT